jgi:hypothetical protein
VKFVLLLTILCACAKGPREVTDFAPPAYSYTNSSGGSTVILPDAGVAWFKSDAGDFDIKAIPCYSTDVVEGFARLPAHDCPVPSSEKFEAHELDGGHSIWMGCNDDAGNPAPPYDEILAGFSCFLTYRNP